MGFLPLSVIKSVETSLIKTEFGRHYCRIWFRSLKQVGRRFHRDRQKGDQKKKQWKHWKMVSPRCLMHLPNRRTDNAVNGQTSSQTLSSVCWRVDRRLRSCTQINPYWLNLLTNEFGGKVLLRAVDLGVTVHSCWCQTSQRISPPWSDGKLWVKNALLLKCNTSEFCTIIITKRHVFCFFFLQKSSAH